MTRRVAPAGVAAACAIVAGGIVLACVGESRAEPIGVQAVDCAFLRVHSTGERGLSVLSRVRLADGSTERIGALGYRVNAIAYAPRGTAVYGLASRDAEGEFEHGAHVVVLGGDGSVADLGGVHRVTQLPFPRGGFAGATAGAVIGDHLVVRDGRALYEIDVNPRSSRYLGLVRVTPLWPAELARTVDDFDVRAADGALYGVTTHVPHHGRVVRIDPVGGRVSHVDGPRLPGGRAYGSAVVGPDDALYAATNRADGRSRLFRVGLGPGATVDEVAVWPAVESADATGCLPAAVPPTTTTPSTTTPVPPTPVPPTPPEPTPTPPKPTPAPAPQVPDLPTIPRTPTTPTGSPPPGAPAPAPPAGPLAPPGPPPGQAPAVRAKHERPRVAAGSSGSRSREATEKKRRWGLTLLVLVLGAGAAASSGRARHR